MVPSTTSTTSNAFVQPLSIFSNPSATVMATSSFISPLSAPEKCNVIHINNSSSLLTRTQMCLSSTTVASPTPTSPTSPASKTLVCTSLTAPTLLEQLTQSRQAADAGADIVEIRVDLLDEKEQNAWQRLLPALNIPAIVTNRASWEGGKSQMSEEDRLGILVDAVKRRVSHIDVELKAIGSFIDLCCERKEPFPPPYTKLILSHHDFNNPLTLSELSEIILKMRGYGPSVIAKIAMAANSAMDNICVFRALQKHALNDGYPCVIIAMGEFGQPSRIAAAKYGGYLTFASVSEGNESAPGQVDLQTLLNVFRFRSISPSTPLYAVLGDPVKQSMSPALHNASMALCELDAAYLPARVEAASYVEFVRAAVDLGFKGMSVTIPGKVPVMDAMNEMDDVAKQIGAMNTVVVSEHEELKTKSLKGYNTDWVAAMSAVEEAVKDGTGLNGKRVVCLGAGGAGRALAFGALARGAASVVVVNRSVEKAQALAKDLGEKATGMSMEEFNSNGVEFDVLMNSTSVGMFPNEGDSPVVADKICEGTVVFDAVYNPLQTKLLKEAEERGCVTVSGMEMFVRQAAEQFKLWFPNVQPPVGTMRQVVLNKLKSK